MVQTIIQMPTLLGLQITLSYFSVVMKGQVCSKLLVLQLLEVQNKNKTTRVVGLRCQTAFLWRALPSRMAQHNELGSFIIVLQLNLFSCLSFTKRARVFFQGRSRSN